jgi:hypothetical protein
VFQISIDAGVVSYAQNGVVFFTSTTPPAYPLSFAVVFNGLGGSISGVTVTDGS